MSPLAQDEDEKLNKWLQPQPDAVQSPTPPIIPAPVRTDMGADDNKTEDAEKIEDSHPGHKPEDLDSYVAGQKAEVDKYGPDQEKAVMDAILAEHGSLGNRLSRGAASFGDALMMNAGKGNPGFLNNLNEREGRLDTLKANEIPKLQSMNAQNMGAKEKLEGMTASTPLGASEVAPLAAFFKRMGVPDSEIPKMLQNPAAARALVEPYATVMSKDEQIKMETMLKQLELSQRGKQIDAETANQQAQRKAEAIKELSGMPWYSRLLHPGISKELESSAGLDNKTPDNFSPDVISYALKHQITPEQANQIKLKRTGGH